MITGLHRRRPSTVGKWEGFSLVEAMVAVGVSALLATALWGFFFSASRQNAQLEKQGQAVHIADSMWAALRDDFRSAVSVATSPAGLALRVMKPGPDGLPVSSTVAYSWEKGIVRRNSSQGRSRVFDFGALFREEYDWKFSCEEGGEKSFSISISIGLSGSRTVYSSLERFTFGLH